MKRSRRKFSAAFKTKVVLEALKEQKTVQEISSEYQIHANQISQWKSQFLSNADKVFDSPSDAKSEAEQERDRLFKTIGEQKIEIDFLKHVLGK